MNPREKILLPFQFKNFRYSVVVGGMVSLFLFILIAALLIILVLEGSNKNFRWLEIDDRTLWLIQFSIYQATASVGFSFIVGLPVAWSLHHQQHFFGRKMLITMISAAIVLPTTVAAFGLITVFGRNGWLNHILSFIANTRIELPFYGITGILIAHTFFNASFFSRILLLRLNTIPCEYMKLSKSLGFSIWQRFYYLEWPAIRFAAAELSIVIFLLCFTSFSIVLMLGGSPKYNTLEVAIYEALKLDFNIPKAIQLAFLQLVICAILIILACYWKNTKINAKIITFDLYLPESRITKRLQVFIISGFWLFYFCPLLAIIIDGLNINLIRLFFEEQFTQALTNSLIIASISALMTVFCSLAICNARTTLILPHRTNINTFTRLLENGLALSSIAYLAVPSLVLGTGFFLITRYLPGELKNWALVAIIITNVLMCITFSVTILTPAMRQAAMRYDRLAFSLGLKNFSRWRFIEWPFLQADIGYIFALSFCLSFGDMGVITLFGSQDFITLPWYLYQKMGSYRTNDAAGIALVLLSITLISFWVFSYLPESKSSYKNNKHKI